MELSVWQITGCLVVALIVGVLITLVVQRWVSKRDNGTSMNGIQWRKNVLLLLGMAYGSLLLIFSVMVASGITAKEAYEMLGVPFVALVGGTLTIAKDLIE